MKNRNSSMKHSMLNLTEHVSCSTFPRSWKDRLRKFFPSSCDFLVGSKCCTKVNERGLALPHMRATKPPQAWVTCIFLASAAEVFIPKSCAFTSGEMIPNIIFLAAEVFWVECVAVTVLESLALCWGTRPEQENEQRQQGGHWAGSRHSVPGIAACWWSWILGIMALTPHWGPWASLPCWVLQGWLGFLDVYPNLPWHGCSGILQNLDLFVCECCCWWQAWVMELFSFRVLESTIWVVTQSEKSCR